jgi:hypothetical protein
LPASLSPSNLMEAMPRNSRERAIVLLQRA